MNLAALQSDPARFRQSLLIDADGQSLRLGEVLDRWQDKDFQALDSGWKSVAGQAQQSDSIRRAWLERPRGHSKTSDLAVMAAWVLFASRRQLSGYAAAADRDQARLLRDAIEKLVQLNPWLSKILRLTAWRIENIHTGSTLEILSSDAPTSYGLTPDFVIVDEITHWQRRDLWDSLISSAAKRANCLMVVITNAGFLDSWQGELRNIIRHDPSWHFHSLDGPQASWITPNRLAEQKRLLPKIAFDRLWLNIWSSGTGDALAGADIDAALTLDSPTNHPEKGWHYFAGLDLGLSRDKAALAVIGRHFGFSESTVKPVTLSDRQRILIEAGVIDAPAHDELFTPGSGRLKLVQLCVWNPADAATGKVSIEDVEETIAALDQRFHLTIGCDPWQAAYLIERLQRRGVPIQPINFVADSLKSMCSATLAAFAEKMIDLYPDPQLVQDLRSLRVVERQYGVRLDSPRGINGHGDCATALALALHIAKTSETHLAAFDSERKLIVYP